MSERAATAPRNVEEIQYVNGPKHYYEVDQEGNKNHISGDSILEAYGYDPKDTPDKVDNSPQVELEAKPLSKEDERWANKEEEAVAAARKTVELDRAKSEAARWNSRVKIYAARDEVAKKIEKDPYYTPTKSEIEALKNGDHQEKLDTEAGKDPITEDDITYYNQMKKRMAERKLEDIRNEETNGLDKQPSNEDAVATPLAPPTPGTMVAEGGQEGPQKLTAEPDQSTLNTDIPAPGTNNALGLAPEVAQNLDSIINKARKAKAEGNYQDYLSAMAEYDKATEGMDPEVANKVASMGDRAVEDTPDGRIPRVSHEDQRKRVETKEIQKLLEGISDRYAQETAKARHGYMGRFAQGNTWLGKAVRKIPGVSSLVEKANLKFNKDLQSAKQEYDEMTNMIGASVGAELVAQGLSPEEIRAVSNAGNIMNERLFEGRVIQYRNEHTKDTNPLVNFWVNAKSKKGKIAKFGIAAGLGLATGLATGGLAPMIGVGAKVGAVVGSGLSGGFLGNYINKRRGKAVLRSENEMVNGLTLNEAQAAESLAQKSLNIQDGDMVKDSRENTLLTEARTDLELADRRSRVRKTVAAAKAGGLLGGIINSELDLGGGNGNSETPDGGGNGETPGGEGETPETEEPGGPSGVLDESPTEEPTNPGPGEDPSEQPEIIEEEPINPGPGETSEEVSNSFNVEAGNGFSHEIQDLGKELGVEVDGDTAYRIYLDAVNQFGSDLTTGGEYSMGGNNFGISSPGMTEWNPGVREFLEQHIKNSVEPTLPELK